MLAYRIRRILPLINFPKCAHTEKIIKIKFYWSDYPKTVLSFSQILYFLEFCLSFFKGFAILEMEIKKESGNFL